MNKFILPKKWSVNATNNAQDKVLTDYINTAFNTGCDYDYTTTNNWYSNILLGDYNYRIGGVCPEETTEITYEQFLKYVLNQDIPKEQPEDNTELNEILIKLLS